jgi:hypothetical protein
MIHISYAIAQFFAIMLGSILRTVGGALAIGAVLLLSLVGVVSGARVMARRRRR